MLATQRGNRLFIKLLVCLVIEKQLEVVFVVDLSSYINNDQLTAIKIYINNLIKSFKLSRENVQFALVAFGDNSEILMLLKDGSDVDSVTEKVKTLSKLGGTRSVDKALTRVNSEIFIAQNGYRNNAKKLVIVLTTGNPHPGRTPELYVAMKQLSDNSAKLLFLGIGSGLKITGDAVTVYYAQGSSYLPSVFHLIIKLAGQVAGMDEII